MATTLYVQKPGSKALSLSSLECLVEKTLAEEPSAKKCKLSLRSPNPAGQQIFFGANSRYQLPGLATSTCHEVSTTGKDTFNYLIPQISISDFGVPLPLSKVGSSFNAENVSNRSLEEEMVVDDDEVFLERNDNNKENYPRIRSRRSKGSSDRKLSKTLKASRLTSSSLYGISPPAPDLSIDEAVCVNSPERRNLQEKGLESVSEAVKNSSGFDIKLLGKGGYGTVVLGSWKNMRVAVKVIARDDKMLSKSRRRTSIDSEMNAIRIPAHENIVKVYGIFDGMEELHSSVIVMEYVGHYNLQNVIESQPQKLKNENFLHSAVTEIGRGLYHCHKNGIVHLDIKPSNVLVISSSKPSGSWLDSCSNSCSSEASIDGLSVKFKIGDFGCSKQVMQRLNILSKNDFYESGKVKDISRPLGTPGYQAPEMLNGKGPITDKCDMYSFGILFWQLVTRTSVPYQGMHQHTVIFKVVSQGLRPNYNDSCHRGNNLKHEVEYKQIFQYCWQQKYNDRPSMPQVLRRLDSIALSSPKAKVNSSNIKIGFNPFKPVHRLHRSLNSHDKRRSSSIRY